MHDDVDDDHDSDVNSDQHDDNQNDDNGSEEYELALKEILQPSLLWTVLPEINLTKIS